MDPEAAHAFALQAHSGQLDRRGLPLVDHIERVAAGAPPEARAVAYLHELLERADGSLQPLMGAGLDPDEADAIVLLTREQGESYEAHAMRIAHGRGRAGTLARAVKLADLDDQLRHRRAPGEPPYGWARQHVLVCTDRYDHTPQAA